MLKHVVTLRLRTPFEETLQTCKPPTDRLLLPPGSCTISLLRKELAPIFALSILNYHL